MPTTIGQMRKVAEGREAEMFAWEEGKILRLYRGGFARSFVEFQMRSLEVAREAGIRVPASYGLTEVDGRQGVILERIVGTDLLTVIGRQPWRVWWVGGITGRTHAAIHSALAPESLPSTHERYARIILSSGRVPDEYRQPALDRLAELPEGDRLLHGDFHPGNVMLQDGEPVVLDWSNATRGDPDADFTRTRMMMALGDPPPGTSIALRLMAKVGRRLLLDAYIRAYRRVRRPDDGEVAAWELPVAVGRMGEGIEAERPALMRLITRLLG